jgi:hypothetical protein
MKNILTGAALLLASSSAFAGLMQTSDEFGTQGSATDVNITNLNETLSVSGFDATLGALSSVTINLFGQIDSEGSIENNDTLAARAALQVLLSQDWSVTTSYGAQYNFASAFTPIWSGESSAQGTFTLSQGDVFSYDATSGEMSRSLTFTGNDLSIFTAGNNIDFTFSTDILNNFRNESQGAVNNFTNINTTGSWGKVDVSYNYTSAVTTVSEPGTIAILALGLVGFAAAKRKKSA